MEDTRVDEQRDRLRGRHILLREFHNQVDKNPYLLVYLRFYDTGVTRTEQVVPPIKQKRCSEKVKVGTSRESQ